MDKKMRLVNFIWGNESKHFRNDGRSLDGLFGKNNGNPLMIRTALLAIFIAPFGYFHYAAERLLTDQDILAYASQDYDQRQKMNTHETLGIHSGVRVVADYSCSDECFANTVPIIRYDLQEGQTCASTGGIAAALYVPAGIALDNKEFCFPKVVVEH